MLPSIARILGLVAGLLQILSGVLTFFTVCIVSKHVSSTVWCWVLSCWYKRTQSCRQAYALRCT
jgi:hypothetical protein